METNVNYQELKNGQEKLHQIKIDLENASVKQGEMKFINSEVGGMTAGQAVCGFSFKYHQLINEMTSLITNTQSFLESVGITFEEADESAARQIEK